MQLFMELVRSFIIIGFVFWSAAAIPFARASGDDLIPAAIDALVGDAGNQQSLTAMAEPWLGTDGELTPERFEKTVFWIAKDAQGRKILESAMRRARVTRVRDMMRFISADELPTPDWMLAAGREQSTGIKRIGNTRYPQTPLESLIPSLDDLLKSEEIAFSEEPALGAEGRDLLFSSPLRNPRRAARKRKAAHADVFFLKADPDYALALEAGVPGISLGSDLSLRKAVLAFGHELVHFAYQTQVDRLRAVAEAPSREEAAYGYVLSPGDEVDAFAFEIGLNARIFGGAHTILKRIRHLFNENGELIGPRRELADFVLDDRGYRKKFEQQYDGLLAQALKAESRAVLELGHLLESRGIEREQYTEEAALYESIGRELDDGEKESLALARKRARACSASIVRIEKLRKQYQERVKAYEDKLGVGGGPDKQEDK